MEQLQRVEHLQYRLAARCGTAADGSEKATRTRGRARQEGGIGAIHTQSEVIRAISAFGSLHTGGQVDSGEKRAAGTRRGGGAGGEGAAHQPPPPSVGLLGGSPFAARPEVVRAIVLDKGPYLMHGLR